MHAVYGVDAFKNVLYRIVLGILARLYGKTLVSHVLKGDDLCPHFVLSQLLAGDVFVLQMIRTVQTSVDAVVGQIQRRKKNDAVAVKRQLYLLRDLEHLLYLLRDLTGEKHGSLAVCQPGAHTAVLSLARTSLLKDLVYQLDIVLVGFRVFKRSQDFFIIDKFLCL